MNKRGTGIKDSEGKSLIVFSEKSYMNKRGVGLPIKAKKEYIL